MHKDVHDRTADPTPRQAQILEVIRSHRSRHGYSPTLQQIGAALGIGKVTVYEHIQSMMKKGLLAKRQGARRNYLEVRTRTDGAIDACRAVVTAWDAGEDIESAVERCRDLIKET